MELLSAGSMTNGSEEGCDSEVPAETDDIAGRRTRTMTWRSCSCWRRNLKISAVPCYMLPAKKTMQIYCSVHLRKPQAHHVPFKRRFSMSITAKCDTKYSTTLEEFWAGAGTGNTVIHKQLSRIQILVHKESPSTWAYSFWQISSIGLFCLSITLLRFNFIQSLQLYGKNVYMYVMYMLLLSL